ncbi:MAG: DHH family phosphoesterase, partial [Clostridia bacterium]|nr:DHH family phosphoesterase [Clostridia bacterium]
MLFKKWSVNPAEKALATELAAECDIDAFVALIAAGRGYVDPYELSEFVSPDCIMADPYELSDMEKAVEIITDAIYSDSLIAIFGDYDVDGVTATALLYTYLKNRGARVIYEVPDREKDGYGINMSAIERMRDRNVDLIITVDNGIAAFDEIKYAKSLGMKVVVTDHHLAGEKIPAADAVIDPHRLDDTSFFKEICGVMVAFKLVSALDGKSPEEMLYEFGDLVAIGTVADVMPLVNENRSAVREGVGIIAEGKRRGVSALLKASGIDAYTITAGKISYTLAPRLNAAGRMGDAARAVELLLTDDDEAARGIADLLCNENIKRQGLEKQ